MLFVLTNSFLVNFNEDFIDTVFEYDTWPLVHLVNTSQHFW